jgi:hypothetical protein
MTVSKSQPKAALELKGNSMNAKKEYSSHSPNSSLRGYEGVRGSGDGAVRNRTTDAKLSGSPESPHLSGSPHPHLPHL